MVLRPALAALALAVLAAGCSTAPQTSSATTTVASSNDDLDIQCDTDATTGSLISKKCTTADQRKASEQDLKTFEGNMRNGNSIVPPGK